MREVGREAERQRIRDRIQKAEAAPEATLVPPLLSPTLDDPNIKVVAAYTRVSTTSLEQVSSIENQTKYYTDKVEKRPGWELYQIYSDEGKSGTSRKRREEFNRMLEDAAAQKFDLIMCASVSRFARNVKDYLQVIKKLKNQNPMHPVGVYFETENCYTLNPDSDAILDMHAMFAEWESRNKSRRMILSYDQRICTGQYPVSDLLGYRHTTDGQLIIQPEEAKTVRFIYLAYISGISFSEIAEILTEKQRSTLRGRTDWNAKMVRAIVQNERRWGDLNARKRIVIDYEERKTIPNIGAKRRYAAFVPNHHEGIVSRDIAKAVKFVTDSNSSIGRGIRELAVVMTGRLKGFVSIFPSWSGIDNKMLFNISMSAYENEELLERKTVSSDCWMPSSRMLISLNTPAMGVRKSRIHLNKKAVDCFREFEYCELLYHPIYKTICLRSCHGTAANAFRIKADDGKLIQEFRSSGLSDIIREAVNEQGKNLKIRGICRRGNNAAILLFYLDESYLNYLNDLETADMEQDAVYVSNPILSELPSRSAVLHEVQELLLSM